MEATNKTNNNLMMMLRLLARMGVTDAVLMRKYQLNRMSLCKIRRGKHLTRAHTYYFKALLKELRCQLDECLHRLDHERHNQIKALMWTVMQSELLGDG